MRNENNPDPVQPEVSTRRERKFDTITFLLAGVLAAIILGAVGYGILNTAKVTTAIPAPTTGLQKPALFAKPLPEHATAAEHTTTGSSGPSR